MAKPKLQKCLVGLELAGDRIRLVAISSTDSGVGSADGRRLRCDEIVIPDAESYDPADLPPASSLLPLIKAALGRMGVGGGQAAVALGGPRMALRYFVGADEPVRAQLQQAIDRSANYVQFGLGDRLVGEHTHKMADGRVHALLAVSAATTIDPLAKALEQAGLRVKLTEPRLVSLMRIASLSGRLNGKPALLVAADADGMDIGVVSNGHMLFSRRPLSEQGRDAESESADGGKRLTRELEKMSRHYVRAFGADEDIRDVFLCGSADQVRPHAESLSGSSEFDAVILGIEGTLGETLAFSAESAAPAQADVAAVGAAAGLMNEGANVVGPNLTSEPEVQRRPSLEVLFRAILWPSLAALLVWGAAYALRGKLEEDAAKMRIEAEHPSAVQTTYSELQREQTRLEQRALRLEELVTHFQHRDSKAVLETVNACVRQGLWLTRVQLNADQQLIIHGAANDEKLIYQFRADLEGAPDLQSATITTTNRIQRGRFYVTDFAMECALSPDAAPSPSDSK